MSEFYKFGQLRTEPTQGVHLEHFQTLPLAPPGTLFAGFFGRAQRGAHTLVTPLCATAEEAEQFALELAAESKWLSADVARPLLVSLRARFKARRARRGPGKAPWA